MVIMLIAFVGVRQVYLFVMAHYILNTPVTVGFGYPVGWMTCCVIEVAYAMRQKRKLTCNIG